MARVPTLFQVDDDSLVRRIVEGLFQSIGTPYQGFPSATSFLDSYTNEIPGCLLTDLRMPGLGGMELLRHCKNRKIVLPVIVWTAHAEVQIAVSAMKSGVFDFLEKPCSNQLLIDTVQQAFIVDQKRRIELAELHLTGSRLEFLNAGEMEVLELLIAGKEYKSIAAQLSVSYKTVESRRARIMHKFEADTFANVLREVINYKIRMEIHHQADGRS